MYGESSLFCINFSSYGYCLIVETEDRGVAMLLAKLSVGDSEIFLVDKVLTVFEIGETFELPKCFELLNVRF